MDEGGPGEVTLLAIGPQHLVLAPASGVYDNALVEAVGQCDDGDVLARRAAMPTPLDTGARISKILCMASTRESQLL